jgi:hypothetical protein
VSGRMKSCLARFWKEEEEEEEEEEERIYVV